MSIADRGEITDEEYRRARVELYSIQKHDRLPDCDDLEFAGAAVDGEQVLYCENCRFVLLTWGGGDE